MVLISRLGGSRRRRKVRPATLRVRLAATVLDTVSGLAALALTVGAAILALGRLGGRHSEPDGPLHAVSEHPPAEPVRAERQAKVQRSADALAKRIKLAAQLLALLSMLRRAERRSLGFRLLGLRLVDVRSGGEPTRRQRLVRTIARRLWQALHRRLLPVRTPSTTLDQEKMHAEIAAARSEHAGDQVAQQHAVMRIYREHRVDTRGSCLAAIARLPLIAAIDIPMPWSPLAQSPVDWLSGTVVAVDRRAHRPGRPSIGRR